MKLRRAIILGFVGIGLIIGSSSSTACKSSEEQQKEDAANAEAAAQDSFTNDYCEIVLECCNHVFAQPKDTASCKKRIGDLDSAMLHDPKARTDCLAQLRKVTSRD